VHQFLGRDQHLFEFNLHLKYAPSELLLDLVWTHCLITSEIVEDLINQQKFDVSQLNPGIAIQAALLHDIGVYQCDGFDWLTEEIPTGKPYIQHTLVGAWILQQEGLHKEVVESAHRHSGVGISNEDIKKYGLNLPEGDYFPQTIIEQLVTYAAKFHSKSPKFKTVEEIEQDLMRFGEDKVQFFRELKEFFGEPNLDQIIPKYQAWHQGFQQNTNKLGNQVAGNLGKLNSAGMYQ
jgi:uncharacterized protein